MRKFTLLIACLCAASGALAKARNPPSPPNIVFILADDLGWAELGCYGNTFNETPHIDRMAKQGMRFTQAYASAPVCSPYRASLLTGQVPARHGLLDYLRPDSDRPLSTGHLTIAEMLKRGGYATGMIGKWHLSGYAYHKAKVEIRATDHGFDEETGTEQKGVGNGANFWPYVFRTQPVSWIRLPENRLGKEEYLTDRLNFEAVEFIERHHDTHQDKPFFLYLSHYAPHSILNGRPDLVAYFKKKHAPGMSTRDRCYLCQDQGLDGDAGHHWAGDHNPHLAAMLKSIDDGVGRITAKLKERGLLENTLVVFTSDNGGETNVTSNAPLRGGKSMLYEGGIRVPLVMQWPALVPPGVENGDPTMNIDFYPTFLEMAGIEPDPKQQLDGVSILRGLRNPKAEQPERSFYWHYPLDKPHFLGGVSAGAIRKGDMKLIRFYGGDALALYDLNADPGEKRNLLNERTRVAEQLGRAHADWLRDLQ